MKPAVRTIDSQPSWIVRSRDVELAVTCHGGQMAPVVFDRRGKRPIRPYYVSPWSGEGLKIDDPVLRPLRGDFFCMPFGANAQPYRGEKHCCHGEPATAAWKFVDLSRSGPVHQLELTMKTKVRSGQVTKRLTLVDGHSAVYSSHVLSGFTGRMPVGHHATLAVPAEEGAMRVATSPFRFGMTPPVLIGDPTIGHYQSFRVNRKFRDLSRVPLMWTDDPWADCTTLPARQGFTDFLAMFKKAGAEPAWTTAVDSEAGHLWFSLKDAAVLPTTAMWISNRGRHTIPWNGRNACLGLEDVCGYFAEGLAPSLRANSLSRQGIPTALSLSAKRPTAVHYIQGAIAVPRGFRQVERVEFAPDSVTFHSVTGKKVVARVHWEYLQSGEAV